MVERIFSGRFCPLTAPFPLRRSPAPLDFLNPAPLQSGFGPLCFVLRSAHMLCSPAFTLFLFNETTTAKRVYSSLCAFAINDDWAETLNSAPSPPCQNFWIRHRPQCTATWRSLSPLSKLLDPPLSSVHRSVNVPLQDKQVHCGDTMQLLGQQFPWSHLPTCLSSPPPSR